MLVLEGRPCLGLENPDNLIERGERIEKNLREAQSAIARLIDQLQRSDVDLIGADLAIADDPVTGKLKASQLIC
jgi:hypothetical protein